MCHCIRRVTSHVDANVMEITLDHTTISRLVKPHSHNGVLVPNAAPPSRKGCAPLGDRFILTWLKSYLAWLLRCSCKGKLDRMLCDGIVPCPKYPYLKHF